MTVNLFIVATEKHCNPQSRVVTKTTKWYMPVLRHTRFRVCAPVVQTLLDRWRYPPKIITIQGISVSQYPADSSAWHLLGSAVQSVSNRTQAMGSCLTSFLEPVDLIVMYCDNSFTCRYIDYE